MWLMAQMKASTIPMKKCTLLRRPFHLRRLFSKTQMCFALQMKAFKINTLKYTTSKFWKIVCEDEKVRARGCISSSAWYKLSFEPSTNSVRFVLFLYYKFMQQKSTNCTNSLNKKTHPNHKVTRRNVQMWLMAQMKAYTMPMKNCTLLCGPFHFRRLFS